MANSMAVSIKIFDDRSITVSMTPSMAPSLTAYPLLDSYTSHFSTSSMKFRQPTPNCDSPTSDNLTSVPHLDLLDDGCQKKEPLRETYRIKPFGKIGPNLDVYLRPKISNLGAFKECKANH